MSIERLKGYAIGGAGGVFGLAASVSVWSIGSALDKNYSDDNRSGNTTPQTANALEGSGGQRADSDAARQSQESSAQSNQYLNNFDRDTANPNQSSTKRVGSLTGSAATKVSSQTPTQASWQAKIDAAGAPSGTTARISSGAVVVAGDAIFVTSNAGLTFTQLAGAVAVGVVAAGAGVTVNTIASNSSAQAGGTLTSSGRGVFVSADNGQSTTATGFAGAAGFVGIGAAVSYVSDQSVSQATISDNAIVNTSGTVALRSNDKRTITGNVASVAVGAIAVGAAFSKVDVGNDNAIETLASIGNGATIIAQSVSLNAVPVTNATANTTGVAGGAFGAASVNFAFVDFQQESNATIGASRVIATKEVVINSDLTSTLNAKGTGVVLSVIGSVGMMYADVAAGRGDNTSEVIAGISGAANISSPVLTIHADGDNKMLADCTTGVGGTIALAGSLARTTSDLATKTLVGDGATIRTGRLGLYTDLSHDIDSVSNAIVVGAVAGQAALAGNTNTSKADITVGSNANISTVEVYAKANNYLIKNKADTNKPVGDQYRNNISSQSFSLVSLGVLTSDNDIGTSANPFQASVSFGPGSSVKAVGRPGRSGVVDISTSTDFVATDRVNIEGVSLLGGISVGHSIIDAVTRSKVSLNGASIENDSGRIGISTLSNGNNHPDATLLVISGFTGVGAAKVLANTNATNQIELTNSRVSALDVALSAGKFDDGSAVGLNSLDSFATARVQTASILPSAALDSVHSNLTENNLLNLIGNTRVVGIRDVQLNARSGLNSSVIEGGVFNYSALPSGHSIDEDGVLNRNNVIDIGLASKVEAGAGSNLTYTIHPMRYDATINLTPDRLNTSLTASEKTSRQLPQDVNFVFAPLNVGEIGFTVQAGYVMHLVNNAFSNGDADAYYRFLPSSEDIVPHLERYADSSRWQRLSQSEIDGLPASDSPVYESDVTRSFSAGLTGKYFIVKPADTPLPSLALRNIGNLLLNQRDDIVGWMADHAGNAEAIARYEAQLIAIDAQLEELGLLDSIRVDGRKIVKKNLDVLFIDLPALSAAPGSIFITADGVQPSTFSSRVSGGQLVAHGDAKVDIRNATPFTLSTNGVTMLDGRSIINNQTLQPGNIYANLQALTNVNSTPVKTVSIIQQKLKPVSGYDMSGLPPFPSNLSQDLYINDGVQNQNGTIYINNYEGSIYISGDVRGQDPVQIISAGNLTINSAGWYHLADPRQYIDFNTIDNAAAGAGPDRSTYTNPADVSDGTKTLAQAIAGTTSRIVSQGRLSLTARFLNLNGLIQSGVDQIGMSISNAFIPPTETITFSDLADRYNNFVPSGLTNQDPRKPTSIPGVTFGSEDIPVDVTWDATKKRFVFGKIAPSGGEIIIAGQILSTGGGKLKVASGFASVNIQNATPYPVVLDEVDTTKNRKGKITIIDSDRLLKTEYLVSGDAIEERNSNGTLVAGHIEYAAPTITPHTFEESISYLPQAGLQYVWVEGQTFSQITREVYKKKSFNLLGDNFIADALVADSSLVESRIESRGEPRRLLLSETREEGGPGIPSYAVDKAYTIDYVRKIDAVISVIPNETLVRNPPGATNGVVYRYVGAATKTIDISKVAYGSDAEWANSGIAAASFVPNPSQGRFESNNRQVIYDPPVVSGGGWLQKKTITTVRHLNEGLKDFFTHTLKADYPVAVQISRGVASPGITINSAGGILLSGNIEAPLTGSISLVSSAGSILSPDSYAIYGNTPSLNAAKEIDLQVEGNRGQLNATAGGNISLTAISRDNATSTFLVGNVSSTSGNVQLIAANGLSGTGTSLVSGNRVELYAKSGAIGSQGTPFRINTSTIAAFGNGVAAWARDAIVITETTGDLVLGKPVQLSFTIPTAVTLTADASVQSDNDNVTLVSATGSIRDGIYEAERAAPIIFANLSLRQQLNINAGIASGALSAQALANPVSPGLMAFLYPHTIFQRPQTGDAVLEQANVKGKVVTLTAASNGSEIGQMGDRVSILNPQNFNALPPVHAALLASATREDIIGVQYATYRYLGGAQNNVDLKLENFSNTARWQKLNVDILTGTSDLVPVNRSVATGQRVLVEFNSEDYGLYEYRGANSTMNLVTQNFRDSSRWVKVIAGATTDGANANLVNGTLVSSKYSIDALAVRRVDDVNVEAATAIIANANARIALESSGDMPLERVVASGDIQLKSGTSILDVGAGVAAIATAGQLRMTAAQDIRGLSNLPLRTQIAPTGSIQSDSTFAMSIQQVAADTTINGVSQSIDKLFVTRASSGGPMKIAVSESDLSIGFLKSTDSIELSAAGSILDAYPDVVGRPVNITATKAPTTTGNVKLTAGVSIGLPTNPIEMIVSGGELTTSSGGSTTLKHFGDLTAGSMTTSNGNITLDNTGSMVGHTLTSVGGGITINNAANMLLHNASSTGGNITIVNNGTMTGDNLTTNVGSIQINNTGALTLGIASTIGGNIGIVNVGNFNGTNLSSGGGNIDINNRGALILNTATATATTIGGNVKIVNVGNLTGQTITSNGGNIDINNRGEVLITSALSNGGSITIVNVGNLTGQSLVSIGGGITITSSNNMLLTSARATGGDIRVTNTGELEVVSMVAVDKNVIINNGGNMLATSIFANAGNVTITNGQVLSVNKISAVQGAVTIVSGKSVIDVSADADSDIDAITISITVLSGSIGEPFDDIEINTADTSASLLIATAPGDIFLTETAGRLNIGNVSSTAKGNVRLATTDFTTAGENINVLPTSVVSVFDGVLSLMSGDDLTVAGSLSARDVYLYADYRNADSAGANIQYTGTVASQSWEIATDDDNDVVVIAAAVVMGATIRTRKGDDEVQAGSGDDIIYAGSGRDRIRGGAGNDWLYGDVGIGDELYGEAGNDRLFGSDDGSETDPDFTDTIRFGDVIDGGDGDDLIWGLGGADRILGGIGIDTIYSGAASDFVSGNDGDDTIYTGTGLSDRAEGNSGNDIVYGSNVGNDFLFGNDGDDKIFGQAGNDTIDGGAGADILDGGAGVDIVSGGLGNDEIRGGGGVGDTLNGDDDDDAIYGSEDGADVSAVVLDATEFLATQEATRSLAVPTTT